MLKIIVQPDRVQMAIRRMCNACWILKITDTHLEYVKLISFLRQQWLHHRVSILRYTYIVCLVCFKPCPASLNITDLRVPILNLKDFLLLHFSSVVNNFHSATCATAVCSGFSNSDISKREIIKFV